ncbi:MAG TPA: hypothetical protein VJX67_27490, partial [Blastocatellia bacterium]|nr:hypothetical protein [Blastocatellia bacterium]
MTVGRVVKSGAVAVAFSMGFSILARAQGWEHRLGSRGLQQSVLTWTGLTPDGPVSTSLVLSCLAHPERGREGIGVSYVIHNFRDIKNFDFFYFSGPDAPGQFRALGAITVRTSGGRAIIFRRRVEGEYSLDNPSTDFEFDAEGLDGLVAL